MGRADRVSRARKTGSKARSQTNGQSEFQEGYRAGPRIYRSSKNTPKYITDAVAKAISEGAKDEDVLELLKPFGNYNDHWLSYRIRVEGKIPRRNLCATDHNFIRRETLRAMREGREPPKFRFIHGREVKDTVVKRLTKKLTLDSTSLELEADEDEGHRNIEVVYPGDDTQVNTSGTFDEDYFEELDAPGEQLSYFEELDAPGEQLSYFEELDAPGELLSGFESYGPDGLNCFPEPNSGSFLPKSTLGGRSCPGEAHTADRTSDTSDVFGSESWLRKAKDIDMESIATFVDKVQQELRESWTRIQVEMEENGEPTEAEPGIPDIDYGGLTHADSHEKWSKYGRDKLNQWLKEGEMLALKWLLWIIEKQKESGDSLHTCYLRLGGICRPTEQYLYFMDWDTSKMMPPPHILLSLFERPESIPLPIRDAFHDQLPKIGAPTPEVREYESRELRRIFEANFAEVIRTSQAHKKNEIWNRGLTSVTVHLLEIERRFGPNHYLLIRAIFRFATVMERAQLESINDKDIIPLLFILLNKISRLKLEDSPTGDVPHALIHLYRSLVRIRNFEGAKRCLGHYRKYKMRIGIWDPRDEEIFHNKRLTLTGMEYSHSKDEKMQAKGRELLREAMSFFGRRKFKNQIIGAFGTTVAVFDFLQKGKYLRFSGSPGEAIESLLMSIKYSDKLPEHELSARKFEGVYELGLCYEKMGLYWRALVCFHDDYFYRKRSGLIDTSAKTVAALRRNLAKCGLSEQTRPTDHALMFLQKTPKHDFQTFETRARPCAHEDDNLEREKDFISTDEDRALLDNPWYEFNKKIDGAFDLFLQSIGSLATAVNIIANILSFGYYARK
ncbi:hypothetical protein TWF718_001851 [Orbilia javanica]|uniref:Uncharacterized protein n=1 Tax=Orbilia javanica TaxID=47235 RepID=A0AAN8N976_9PEZI